MVANAGRGVGPGPCVLGALVAIVATVSAVQAQRPALTEFTIDTVAPGVLVASPTEVGHFFVEPNVTFIVGEEAALVVDAGFLPSTGRRLSRLLESHTDVPPRYLLNTHWHGDHWYGNGGWRATFSELRFIASARGHEEMSTLGVDDMQGFLTGGYGRMVEELRAEVEGEAARADSGEETARERADATTDSLAEKRRRLAAFEQALGELGDMEVVTPEPFFGDSVRIDLGGLEVVLLYLGEANTGGDALVYVLEQRLLVTGDVVVHPRPYPSSDDFRSWIEVLHTIQQMDVRTLVPGHGAVQSGTAYAGEVASLYEALTEIVVEERAAGRDLEAVRASVDVSRVERLLERNYGIAPGHFGLSQPWLDWAVGAVFESSEREERAPLAQVAVGDDGPAVDALLHFPTGVAVHDSHLYVTEQRGHRVRRVDLGTGVITTVAGTGEEGFSGDGGPATQARLNQPENIAVDLQGHLYIGDLGNHRIRRVDVVTGRIATVAGSGAEGFSGDGGPATRAAISNPFGLVVHPDGDLYFADTENQRIRKIDAGTGIITTVAGNGRRGFGGDGGPATEAMLSRPHVLAIHPDGDLLIGDSFNQRIRRLDRRTGVIETIAGTGEQGTGGDGGPAADAAFVFFGELAVDPRGRLLLSGVGNHTVRAIDLDTGVITRIAGTGRWDFGGDGGPALDAHFHLPYGLDVDDEGNVYVADFWNWRVRRIDATSGTVSTVAGGVPPPDGTDHYHFHHQEPSETEATGSPVPTGVAAAGTSSELRAGAEPLTFVRLESEAMARDTSSSPSASWIDIDLDGDEDLYVLNGYGSLETEPTPQRNVLYLNDGHGTFTPVEEHPLVADVAFSGSSTWGDYDNDGDADVFVANQRGADNFLFRNDGSGRFVRIREGAPVSDGGRSFSAVWVDIDGDGSLDLHVLNGRDGSEGEADFVYRNDGNGTLVRVADAAFAVDTLPSGGGTWADYDEDGDPDLFLPVHRTGEPSRLYRNDGAWAFVEIGQEAGLDPAPLPSWPASSAAHWVDHDNDEDLDLFVGTTPPSMIDLLYQNDGTGRFDRATAGRVGLDATYVSDALWADFDNDADLDLVIAVWGGACELYLNDGRGQLVAATAGDLDTDVGFASSVSASDIEGDGDLDLYLTQWPINEAGGAPNRLYRNDSDGGNWLKVEVEGSVSNRSAVGARIVVQAVVQGRTVRQTRVVTSRTSWRSANGPTQHFGLGDAEAVDRIEVVWPSGRSEIIPGPIAANRRLRIVEDAGLVSTESR